MILKDFQVHFCRSEQKLSGPPLGLILASILVQFWLGPRP